MAQPQFLGLAGLAIQNFLSIYYVLSVMLSDGMFLATVGALRILGH